jgi:hypothetical protein
MALGLLGARQLVRAQSDTAALRLILERRYAQQDSAIAQRRLDSFLATLAPNYRVELRDGQSFTRPAIDSAIARDMRQTRAVTSVATILESLRMLGDTAWATVVHRADRMLLDQQGRPHRWENGVRHDEQWVRRVSEWRIVALRECEQLFLRRDGKPIP